MFYWALDMLKLTSKTRIEVYVGAFKVIVKSKILSSLDDLHSNCFFSIAKRHMIYANSIFFLSSKDEKSFFEKRWKIDETFFLIYVLSFFSFLRSRLTITRKMSSDTEPVLRRLILEPGNSTINESKLFQNHFHSRKFSVSLAATPIETCFHPSLQVKSSYKSKCNQNFYSETFLLKFSPHTNKIFACFPLKFRNTSDEKFSSRTVWKESDRCEIITFSNGSFPRSHFHLHVKATRV